MSVLNGFISTKEVLYPNINRKITIDDIEECLKHGFPLIYDSVNRGKGLALRIIEYLGKHGNASMYKLKKEFKVELHSIKKILSRMEEKGYVAYVVEKGKGPRGRFLFYLTPIGSLVYHVVFTQKPYSWLISHVLEKGKEEIREDFIVKFLEENKGLLRNSAFEELMNYLFIKHLRVSVEDLYKYTILMIDRGVAKTHLAVLLAVSTLSSIPAIVIKYHAMKTLKEEVTEDKIFYILSTQYMELPSLFPITPNEEFYEDALGALDDLLGKNAISDSEVFNFLRTYLKYVVISMQLYALINSSSFFLNLVAHKDPSIDINDLSNRIEKAIDTIAEIVKAL